MCGRSKLALILCCALSGALAAQSLPDIGAAKVEGLKLALLDDKGNPAGSLSGKVASKDRAGRITIEGAVIEVSASDGRLKLAAPKLAYDAGKEVMDFPEGLQADLPDGGLLTLAASSANVSAAANLSLAFTSRGDSFLRLGPEAASYLTVKLTDAEGHLSYGKGRVDSVRLKGPRGGRFAASLSRFPSLVRAGSDAGQLELLCFGEAQLSMTGGTDECVLGLNGRVSCKALDQGRAFKLSCDSLEWRSRLSGGSLLPLGLRAEGGVRMEAEGSSVSAGALTLDEGPIERQAVLSGGADARFWREQERLFVRARKRATLRMPAGSRTGAALHVLLEGDAQLKGLTAASRGGTEHADWELQGDFISCRRQQLAHALAGGMPEFYQFDVRDRGFAPLLSLARSDGTESLSLRGKAARGLLLGSALKADIHAGVGQVDGPDVLAIAAGPFNLLPALRYSLGLREQADGVKPPAPAPGRLWFRAQARVQLGFSRRGAMLQGLAATADDTVELREEPLIRNDRELVTLRGARIACALREEWLESLLVEPDESGEARASLGFDLLHCRRIALTTEQAIQTLRLAGPGRLVMRDRATLDYMHALLARQDLAGDLFRGSRELRADAGWARFESQAVVINAPQRRTFELEGASLALVRGGFEPPRAGQGAFSDLDELLDDDVEQLYEATARRLLGDVSKLKGAHGSVVTAVALTLEGEPRLRSRLDGLFAMARDSLTLAGAELLLPAAGSGLQRFDQGTLIQMRGGARIEFLRAASYFDERGRLGGVSYDGPWSLLADDELTVSILAPALEIQSLRQELKTLPPTPLSLSQLDERIKGFAQRLVAVGAGFEAGADRRRVSRAVQFLRLAQESLDLSCRMGSLGHGVVAQSLLDNARGLEAAAFAVLGPEVQALALGNVEVRLSSSRPGTLPVMLTMRRLDLSLDGMGAAQGLEGEGPVRVSRGRYAVSGREVRMDESGVLTLDGAGITLPVEIGFELGGVTEVALQTSGPRIGRVRVSGRGLTVKATLARPSTEAK